MATRMKQMKHCQTGRRYFGAFPLLFLLWKMAQIDLKVRDSGEIDWNMTRLDLFHEVRSGGAIKLQI